MQQPQDQATSHLVLRPLWLAWLSASEMMP